MNKSIFKLNKDLMLESGQVLRKPHITYHTYGKLNKKKNNVIWITHALTASSDVYEWWPGLVGKNDYINEKEHFIVCANILGSHYGTTSPLSINPENQKPYYHDFPNFTIRDIVQLHIELAAHLEIDKIHLLIGGSMGGHQALEWSILEPSRINYLVLLATSAVHSPWGVAFNESQRAAIENDPSWPQASAQAGRDGMKVARSIALLSYRNYRAYVKTQQPSDKNLIYPDRAGSYQRYQGEKLAHRFNAFSYWYLSKAMDSQNISRNRNDIPSVLKGISAKTLILSIEDDVLFPLPDQQELVQHIPDAEHQIIQSDYGHDGFLIETDKITHHINQFLNKCNENEHFNNIVCAV